MKKAIQTIVLFSMVLVLTSFTTTNIRVDNLAPINHTINVVTFQQSWNGQQVPASKQFLELALEPGGNGQQVPASRPSL